MTSPLSALGRRHAPDKRDKQFLLRTPKRGELAELPRRRVWNSAGVLDQGDTPQCVAYSWTKWLTGGPVTNTLPFPSISVFYRECQRNDEWPGEDYDGSSVRAGAKVLKARNRIESYAWAFELEPVILHILSVGPVVFGTDWHIDMFTPDRWGYIEPTGDNVGGHAYAIIGVDRDRKHPLTNEKGAFRMINSWGPGWGQKGRAWMSFSCASALINADGEACTAFEKKG